MKVASLLDIQTLLGIRVVLSICYHSTKTDRSSIMALDTGARAY